MAREHIGTDFNTRDVLMYLNFAYSTSVKINGWFQRLETNHHDLDFTNFQTPFISYNLHTYLWS